MPPKSVKPKRKRKTAAEKREEIARQRAEYFAERMAEPHEMQITRIMQELWLLGCDLSKWIRENQTRNGRRLIAHDGYREYVRRVDDIRVPLDKLDRRENYGVILVNESLDFPLGKPKGALDAKFDSKHLELFERGIGIIGTSISEREGEPEYLTGETITCRVRDI